MARSYNGTTDRTSFPMSMNSDAITLFARQRSTSLTVDQIIASVCVAAASDTSLTLQCGGNSSADKLFFRRGNSSTFASGLSVASYASGVWETSAIKTVTQSSFFGYLNAVEAAGGTTGVSQTTVTFNTAVIAAFLGSSAFTPSFIGDICSVAIWITNLTQDEITALDRGFSPRRIRPQSLRYYAPLVRDVQELFTGAAITEAGTPSAAAGPRLYGM